MVPGSVATIGLARTKSAEDYFGRQNWDFVNHFYWGPFGVSTILEQEGLPFTLLSDDDLGDPNLLKKFEAIVLCDQPF